MALRMIRPAVPSVSVPSRPYPTSIRMRRSFGNDNDQNAVVLPFLSELPCREDLDGVILDALPPRLWAR